MMRTITVLWPITMNDIIFIVVDFFVNDYFLVNTAKQLDDLLVSFVFLSWLSYIKDLANSVSGLVRERLLIKKELDLLDYGEDRRTIIFFWKLFFFNIVSGNLSMARRHT